MNRLNITGWFRQKRIDAIEVFNAPDGTHYLNHVAVMQKGNQLELISVNHSMKSFQQLAGVIPEGSPVVLILTGKGVLMRNSEFNRDASVKDLIRSVFPDAQADDFLLSKESLFEKGLVVCLTRTKQAKDVINRIQTHSIFVSEVLIGPLTVSSILPLLEPETSPVYTGHYSFFHRNGQLVDVQSVETEYPADFRVEEMTVPANLVIPFAAAFEFLIVNHGIPTTPLPAVKDTAQRIRIQSKIKRALAVMIGLLFVILFFNFFIFDHYTRKYTELASVVEENRKTMKQTDSLRELIQHRELFYKQSFVSNNLKGSFIIDRIAGSKPAGIFITDFSVRPIRFKEDEMNKEPQYQPRLIRILASVNESDALNQWIKRLEDLEWVESVAFNNYREKEDHDATVTLEITIR